MQGTHPKSPSETTSWARLEAHARRLKARHLRDLCAQQGAQLGAVGALLVDLSKHKVDAAAWTDLYALAEEMQLRPAREAMWRGEKVNASEGRAVLHVALRAREGELVIDGSDLGQRSAAQRARAGELVGALERGDQLGATGKPLTTLVHVGIGGSDLGPRLAVDALRAQQRPGVEVRFLSNIDGHALDRALEGLDPEQTLVCVASKSFTTQETLHNATSVRGWLRRGLGLGHADKWSQHFVAVTTKPAVAKAWGIDEQRIFEFWPWVGGRFSVWSCVGFPLMFAIGAEGFEAFVAGAREIDEHVRHAPIEENLPVRSALLGVFYGAFFDAHTRCVVPYDERLAALLPYMQQIHMESNGKPGAQATSPVIWGGPGTDSQHQFFQLLHQGTHFVPVEFLAVRNAGHEHPDHHARMLANCFAQSHALMKGSTEADTPAHLHFEGDNPSTTVMLDELTPRALGNLLAYYEHEVAAQGSLWGLNSFDQWGVQLGKSIANQLLPAIEDGAALPEGLDASTQALLAWVGDEGAS